MSIWMFLAGLLILLVPLAIREFVANEGIMGPLRWFSPIAVIAIVVMIVMVRWWRNFEGATAIKTIIVCMYVLLAVFMLPAIGALDIHGYDILAAAVYAVHIVSTFAVWFLVESQTINDRVAAWREKKSPTPRTRGVRLPSPNADGDSSEEQHPRATTRHEQEKIDDE